MMDEDKQEGGGVQTQLIQTMFLPIISAKMKMNGGEQTGAGAGSCRIMEPRR